MSPRLLIAIATFASLCLSVPPGARAQDAAPDVEARRAFRLGRAHYENGQFQEAAERFEEAYRLSGRVRLLYNAYVAYRDLQDQPNAARTLRSFLEQATPTDLEGLSRSQLGARLEAIEAALEDEGGGADEPESEPDEPESEPEADDAPSVAPSAATEPASDEDRGGESLSPVGFVVAGAGVLLGVGAIIAGVLSSDQVARLESDCPDRTCVDTPELRSAQSDAEALAITTDVLWVSGALAVAAGVVLIAVLRDGGDDSVTASAMCDGQGCAFAVGGRF